VVAVVLERLAVTGVAVVVDTVALVVDTVALVVLVAVGVALAVGSSGSRVRKRVGNWVGESSRSIGEGVLVGVARGLGSSGRVGNWVGESSRGTGGGVLAGDALAVESSGRRMSKSVGNWVGESSRGNGGGVLVADVLAVGTSGICVWESSTLSYLGLEVFASRSWCVSPVIITPCDARSRCCRERTPCREYARSRFPLSMNAVISL